MPPPVLRVRAPLLAPGARGLRFHPDGLLEIGEDGLVVTSGPFPSEAPGPFTDLRPLWILPGLVDLHTHLPQLEAVACDGLELLPWLETHVFPAEAAFADPDHAERIAERFIQALLAAGTTTAVLWGSSHPEATERIFRVAQRTGIRAVVGLTLMDRNAPSGLLRPADRALQDSEALCRRWHGTEQGRLRYAFTPRFAPACTPALLRGAGELARTHKAFVQTHLSENLRELEWVRELFPESPSYTAVYADHGLLGPRTLLGHGIHLEPAERNLIRESGATVVHCPSSNAFLQSGIMPLRRWMDEAISLGLGTDVGAGPELSLWREMATACTVSKLLRAGRPPEAEGRASDAPLRPGEAFALATLGGAAALGLADRLGCLEAGQEADFIVVDPRACDPLGRPGGDPRGVLARLLYRADPGMVRASFVRGRRCFSREA
ncbi:MAG: guanine deaminase [Acidobacteria bacterium]|nr:guanine deaminase [Acidobacteriota bacterium]